MGNGLHSGEAAAGSRIFDVCVVGHVTKDIVKLSHATKMKVGGTAYFTALAMAGFGLDVAVVTKGREQDREFLLQELALKKVCIFWRPGEATTVFESIYSAQDLDTRVQVIHAVGTPFAVKDLDDLEDVDVVRATMFHFGPLVRQDIPLGLLQRISGRAEIVSLDVQGMVRPKRLGAVIHEDWADKEEWLQFVDVLKADEREACIISGESDVRRAAAFLASVGPKEVIVTLGSRGSVVCSRGVLHEIPSWPPRRMVDPTGCGDTYMAGYLYKRLKGVPPEAAGRFAAATATLKLEGPGPFAGTEKDVDRLLARFNESFA